MTANPISKVDDYVKHIFREHNQEVDHWANLGVEGQRKILVDWCSNSETWKAVKGFWDGSSKDNGKSGCGVVIKGFDRDRWVTIGKIALPLKVSTAMAAEVIRKTLICFSTNVCAFKISTDALTKFLTNKP